MSVVMFFPQLQGIIAEVTCENTIIIPSSFGLSRLDLREFIKTTRLKHQN